MKVAPKLLDLASLNHHPKGFIGEFRLPPLAPATSLEDFAVVQDPFELEVACNPFVEMETPVYESMRHGGHVLTVPAEFE